MIISKENKDLQRERQRCSFDPSELTHLLDGSAEKTEKRRERGIILLAHANNFLYFNF